MLNSYLNVCPNNIFFYIKTVRKNKVHQQLILKKLYSIFQFQSCLRFIFITTSTYISFTIVNDKNLVNYINHGNHSSSFAPWSGCGGAKSLPLSSWCFCWCVRWRGSPFFTNISSRVPITSLQGKKWPNWLSNVQRWPLASRMVYVMTIITLVLKG